MKFGLFYLPTYLPTVHDVQTHYRRIIEQVEIYFSIIQRKGLTPNDFADLEAIRLRLAVYEALSNQSPTPFQWTCDRTTRTALLTKIAAHQGALPDAQGHGIEEAA